LSRRTQFIFPPTPNFLTLQDRHRETSQQPP
jgi:hypothetical protein